MEDREGLLREEEILGLQQLILSERQMRLFAEFELCKRDMQVVQRNLQELKEKLNVKDPNI